jgi:hypothetical protein
LEDETEDGQMLGPLIVWDHQKNELFWESEDWLPESEARMLAEERGWRYAIDGPTPEEFAEDRLRRDDAESAADEMWKAAGEGGWMATYAHLPSGRVRLVALNVFPLPLGSKVYIANNHYKTVEVALVMEAEDGKNGIHLWLEAI